MSASNLNEKNQAFHRLLHDLHQDSLHNEVEEEREHLPKMAQSASLMELRSRLRERYRRSRISPTWMYMPRTALTAAILMTCTVAYLYITRLREIKHQEQLKQQKERQKIDSIIRESKRLGD